MSLLDWTSDEEEFSESYDEDSGDISVFYFFQFLCLSAFCAAAVNRIWLSSFWLLLALWLLSQLLVVPSTFVTGSICFILKRDISSVSLLDMMEGNLLKTFLQSKNRWGPLVEHPLSSRTKLEWGLENGLHSVKRVEVWGIQLLRSRRLYEIKIHFCASSIPKVNTCIPWYLSKYSTKKLILSWNIKN